MRPFNASGAFQSPTDGGGLRRLAVRGAGITVLAQGLAFAVQMIATVVLARLLMPADFGVVAMVTTFSVLLVACGHAGIPDAVLQRDEIDHFLASNLFWISLGTGLVLAMGFAATGSLLARFYGDPRVAHVTIGLSLTVVIDSTSVLHLALLRRAMHFTTVSANDIVARIVSVAVSILLAWGGCGYWSLVAGAVAYPMATSIGAWTLCRWVPSLPRRAAGTGSVVRFWISVFGHYSVSYFTQNTDNLLVGWRLGSGALGLYKKAYDLFVLPFSLLNVFPVVVSTLSRLSQDTVKYRRYFLNGLSILALVGMAVGAEFTLVGKDLVRLLLGTKWEATGRIFTFFGPGIGAMLMYNTHGMIHLSIGTTRRYFRWGIIEFTVTVLLFLLALRWGAVGIAAAWTASYWILTIPALWYAGRPIQLGITPMLGAAWRCVLASLLAGCVCGATIQRSPSLVAASGSLGALVRIAATSVLLAILYIGAVILLHGGLAPLHQFVGVVREMVTRSRLSRPVRTVHETCGNDASVVINPTATGETS